MGPLHCRGRWRGKLTVRPFLVLLLPALLLLNVSCSGDVPESPPAVLPTAEATRAAPPPAAGSFLTGEGRALRQAREQHSALIASMPPTPGPTSTPTAPERSAAASVRVREHPEGIPVPPRVGEDWFDPALGLEFYRDSGGDWTPRRVREDHSHRDLFYYDDYPDSVANFSDGSIYRLLAREMVFEAAAAMPLLGDPTPAMVGAFSKEMGWELRDSPEPAVNVWTTFTVRREGQFHSYAVGGVMLMGALSLELEDGRVLEYVVPGHWVGPVVVERLR